MKLESSAERHTIRFSRCRKCPHHRKLRDAAPPRKCTNCRGQQCHSPKETISCRKPINTTKLPRISPQAHPLVCCRKTSPLLSPSHHSLGHYLPKLYHPMALRLSISSSQGPASSPVISTCRPTAYGRFPALLGSTAASQKRSLTVMSGSEAMGVTPVKSSSLETASVGSDVVAVTGQVTEVTKETFWPIVKAAGPKVVVLDMYTQWCGPCKVMAPKFQEMSEKNLDVVFLKLDCNQDNRPLAKELGIRVVPTFKILKDGKVVKEVTGAKIDELAHAIETVKSS